MAIDLYKFYIVRPQAGRNYVTNPQPYAVTTGYTNYNGSMALDDTYTRRGSSCLKITPQTGKASGVFYSTVSVTSGLAYAFSVDVKGVDGQAMRIYIANSAGTAKATTTFTATGNWQRISVTHTAAETKTDYRLYVVRDSVASTSAFWVDGFQFEQAVTATTWIYGYERGLGYIDDYPEYGWEGAAGGGGATNSSVSWRSRLTRHGGALVDIATYADIVGAFGLGMGPIEQVTTPIVTGGALYQKHIRQSRQFSLALRYYGDTLDEIQKKRKALLNLLRPDYTSYDQPLVIRYQGYDVDGNEASDPVDIVCVLETCHTDPPNSPTHQEDVLTFTVLDGHLQGAFRNGTTLDYKVEFAADYIVRRDPNGSWVTHAGGGVYVNPLAGVTGGSISDIKEAPNGDIYICGAFTGVSNGGSAVAKTKGIARWSKVNQKWEAVGDPNTGATITTITGMAFDAAGNLFVVGNFLNLANVAAADHIAKWDGTNWNAVGGGVSGPQPVSCLAISPTGLVYIGGFFTSIGGDTNCKYIACWDGSSWNPLSTGLNGPVYALKIKSLTIPQGLLVGGLLIGGAFTSADGTNGDYICYWYGTEFKSFYDLGATELSNAVYSIDITPGGTIVIGGEFTNAGGDPNADHVAAWRGTNWGALRAGGVNNNVHKVHCDRNGDIYLAGGFTQAGNLTLTDRIVVSKGGAYQPLDIDLPGSGLVYSICKASDNSLYLGGTFKAADGNAVAIQTAETIYETASSSGSANTYPSITVVGPGVLHSISNFSTGQKLTFNGLTLLAGERLMLHLDPTALKMTSGWSGRGSVWHYLNAGSDVGNWYMRPGVNYLGVFIPSGYDEDDTKVYITWQPKYWSLDGAVY